MRHARLFVIGIAAAFGWILSAVSTAGVAAQPAGPATTSQGEPAGMPCNGTRMLDPFNGALAAPVIPPGVLPIDDKDKSDILSSGLPCQENVSTAGKEDSGLRNLQRGFDFYSWRTFIALNSPADGTSIERARPDTQTRWEDANNFKQLLDVMLPAELQPPVWSPDRAGRDKERERMISTECKALHRDLPDWTVVKMIEESFNEPFKTGPLIDQDGHYAIFEILMNREMFGYIMAHHLNTKVGQARADNDDLLVDFPVGQNLDTKQNVSATLGAFMLKVSWKILSPAEVQSGTFHIMHALVLMPPGVPGANRPCLKETLGLVGFHAVHKTLHRPQWIWTTFEHKKNVPDMSDVAAHKLDGPYNFFSVSCKDHCPMVNAIPPRPWAPDPTLGLQFRKDNSFKSQIVRQVALTDATQNMNKIFHSLLPPDSVWQNYILVSTQWPSGVECTSLHSKSAPDPKTDFAKQPDMTCSPAPTFLANSTLETYSQGNTPLASSSCIACHGNAVDFQRGTSAPPAGTARLNQSDFTFMLEKAQ
jgi:hypothetical protein